MTDPGNTVASTTPALAVPKRLEDCRSGDFYSGCASWDAADEVLVGFEDAARKFANHLDETAVEAVASRLHDDLENSIDRVIDDLVASALGELVALEDDLAAD
jgi:hypothetical protein